jgi:ubiquinol-cytochrome c reductase iron-sulfur subunit
MADHDGSELTTADSAPHPPTTRTHGTELAIAGGFVLAIVSSLGLAVLYALGGQTQLEGLLLFLTLFGLGFGMAGWGKYLMPNGPYVQQREALTSTPEERESFVESFVRTGQVGRRRFLRRLLAGAAGAFGVALLFPIRSLGPNPGSSLNHTDWAAGSRAVDEFGKPVHVDDVQPGGVVTVFPEGHAGDATDQTLLIRASDQDVVTASSRATWGPSGYVAYSKVCTHAGCPVGLYQQATQQLLCPCHQSLFDVLRGAVPVFGPAPRSLPQLPLMIDADGFIRSQRDFEEPIGPAFWNRS